MGGVPVIHYTPTIYRYLMNSQAATQYGSESEVAQLLCTTRLNFSGVVAFSGNMS